MKRARTAAEIVIALAIMVPIAIVAFVLFVLPYLVIFVQFLSPGSFASD